MTKQSVHGDGSVFYEADRDRWVGSISLGRDPLTGKRRRVKVVGATSGEATKRMRERRAALATPSNPAPRSVDIHTRSAPHRVAYSMNEVVTITGVSRSQLYDEINTGRLATRKVGRRRIILAADLDAWLAALPVG